MDSDAPGDAGDGDVSRDAEGDADGRSDGGVVATAPFSTTYTGWDEAAGAAATYQITGRRPSSGGPFPVLVYTVGTLGAHDRPGPMAWVERMAEAGFVAATVEYSNDLRFTCPALRRKAEGIYSGDGSAISTLCSMSEADCGIGIVTAGHSQGSMMALLAHDYDDRVRATLALGTGFNLVGPFLDHEVCLVTERTLPNDRLRATNGLEDGSWGSYTSEDPPGMIEQLNGLTGQSCLPADEECLRANGSGWVVVQSSEVTDGVAEHCYFNDATGASRECTAPLDPLWLTTTERWGREAGVAFLSSFVGP